ncbi:acetyl-CoA carboxylase biotin carboxyl carrier protein [Labrys sp. ZIDIC5]|nr:acetyl-CoA carboxylase biotin carboxyl carrier protein [Labrys sp. ZIDIC5]MDZ5449105.1 acetyl-CoA carboxylase biotin carboxyl carrier protein [Labrys sp. ZIDIC5]
MSRTKSGIDPEIIRELANLLTETDLTEIEVQQADLRIRVARQINVTATVPVGAPAVAVAAPAVVAAPAAADPANHPGVLKSPMVGTAYLGAAPGAKAFVEIGSKVNQGDRVLIVEAMKTFNDIIAPRSGTVTTLFIEDKQPVEYGQPLMIIE